MRGERAILAHSYARAELCKRTAMRKEANRGYIALQSAVELCGLLLHLTWSQEVLGFPTDQHGCEKSISDRFPDKEPGN